MTWAELDWAVLDRLRQRFLAGPQKGVPYWQNHDDLAHYDFTYGERIGWKWDAVLGELQRRGWRPPAGVLWDWGCGSGVAGRRVIRHWRETFTELHLSDHSAAAVAFAAQRARAEFPGLQVGARPPADTHPVAMLVVSHVLNELDALGRGALLQAIEAAETVLWVEPGTSEVAHDLVQWRERLRAHFRFVLPCPHQDVCGLLRPGNERHWCHHFAAPPTGIYADANWVRFGQRAGIDLRSLPYSVLVMERISRPETAPVEPDAHRILGRPEVFKPYARLLDCRRADVVEITLPKRTDPALYRRIDRPESPRLWAWELDGTTIRGARPLVDPREET